MKRAELESFIMETYNAETDYPWLKYPNYEVFRHCNNRKWFALIMDVPKNKLGLQGEEMLKVVDFKCDPILKTSISLKFQCSAIHRKKYTRSCALLPIINKLIITYEHNSNIITQLNSTI